MNGYLPIVFIAVAFAAAACAVLAVGMVVLARQSTAEKIGKRIGLEESPAGEVPIENLARDAEGWFDRYFYGVIAESGLEIAPLAVLLMMVGMAAVAAAAVFVFTDHVGLAAMAAIAGFWPPLLWIAFLRGRRIQAMETLMPGALDQMADCLQSGQTLEQAAEMVSIQTASPLKEEFGHCVRLLKMGQSPVAVMDRLSRRIPLPEFRLFATAVLVHRQTGGNLARLTSRLAISARDRQEWRRHLGAQTVAGRYSAVGLIACGVIGFAILSVSRPQYTEFFFTHPSGPRFLLIAMGLAVIGSLWIASVVRIRY